MVCNELDTCATEKKLWMGHKWSREVYVNCKTSDFHQLTIDEVESKSKRMVIKSEFQDSGFPEI